MMRAVAAEDEKQPFSIVAADRPRCSQASKTAPFGTGEERNHSSSSAGGRCDRVCKIGVRFYDDSDCEAQDMCIQSLAGKEIYRSDITGYLKEYDRD